MGIFKLLKRTLTHNSNTISSVSFDSKKKPPLDIETYLDEVLPNGNTIAEQQKEDYNTALGNYQNGTPKFLEMNILSSIVPPNEGYDYLSEEEQKFFTALREELIKAKYSPGRVRLTRLSSGTFNVDYVGVCHLGKICLYKNKKTYMQFFIGLSKIKELQNPSLQECIETIPRWIKYINYCKKH